jgi:hypothetical protein
MAARKPPREKVTIPHAKVYTGKYAPYAEQQCADCGALGCLIPFKHSASR